MDGWGDIGDPWAYPDTPEQAFGPNWWIPSYQDWEPMWREWEPAFQTAQQTLMPYPLIGESPIPWYRDVNRQINQFMNPSVWGHGRQLEALGEELWPRRRRWSWW